MNAAALLQALRARFGATVPLYVHYGVTHRCNMRCRMCVVWRSADPARELTLDGVRALAALLQRAGTRAVALGGGEPFVRPDLPGLVAAFASRGMEVRVLTNGIGVSDAQADAVIAAGAAHVSISLDSVSPDVQNAIYGGKPVWDDILRAIRRFGARLRSPPAVPVLNTCVSRLNLDELPALVAFAIREGWFCSFVPVALSASEEQSDGFAAVAPEMAVRPEDHARLEAAYAQLLSLKASGAPIANSSRFLRDSVAFLKTGRCDWSCDAGRLYLSVSPDGGVSICHRFDPFCRHDDPALGSRMRRGEADGTFAGRRAACPGCMRPCWAELTHAVRHLPSSLEALRVARRRPRIARRREGGAA